MDRNEDDIDDIDYDIGRIKLHQTWFQFFSDLGIFAVFLMTVAGFCFGCGTIYGDVKAKQEAIRAGVAAMIFDPASGKERFVFLR